jgi:hypothetical protein
VFVRRQRRPALGVGHLISQLEICQSTVRTVLRASGITAAGFLAVVHVFSQFDFRCHFDEFYPHKTNGRQVAIRRNLRLVSERIQSFGLGDCLCFTNAAPNRDKLDTTTIIESFILSFILKSKIKPFSQIVDTAPRR